jgi:hypothetical protein
MQENGKGKSLKFSFKFLHVKYQKNMRMIRVMYSLFLGATRGFLSSIVEIVGAHEYIKSHREFYANGQLCALWAISQFT